MKLVFASDSFKGSLSSERICELLKTAAEETFPNAECVCLRMADGGEGTVAAISALRSGEEVPLYVYDALKRPIRCNLFISGDEAFVEAATTCGLAMLDEDERDPLATTSNGVGAFISHALFHGCRRITVGLGGTSTNDGGMGCLRALGVRFLDCRGNELAGRGADLANVASIDESGLLPQVRDAEFVIMSDVTNPLLGPNGATHVFAPQKGASEAVVQQLESGMRNFAEVVQRAHPDADMQTPGFGAAGGLGMALSVFLGAKMSSGVQTLLQWVDFDRLLDGANLVVTGEGQLDFQSLQGKVISGVAEHAQRKGVPVAVICGKLALTEDQLSPLGLSRVIEAGAGQTTEQAMANAESNYLRAARTLFAGM